MEENGLRQLDGEGSFWCVDDGVGNCGCGLQVCEIKDEVGSVCGVWVTSSTVKVLVDWERW